MRDENETFFLFSCRQQCPSPCVECGLAWPPCFARHNLNPISQKLIDRGKFRELLCEAQLFLIRQRLETCGAVCLIIIVHIGHTKLPARRPAEDQKSNKLGDISGHLLLSVRWVLINSWGWECGNSICWVRSSDWCQQQQLSRSPAQPSPAQPTLPCPHISLVLCICHQTNLPTDSFHGDNREQQLTKYLQHSTRRRGI